MKTFVAAVSLIVAHAATAHAADPAVNWAGWYAGLNAGYDWSDFNLTTDGDGPRGAGSALNNVLADDRQAPSPRTNRFDLASSGFSGGGQFGYNWRFKNWVAGLEADLQFSNVTGRVNYGPPRGQQIVLFDLDSSVALHWFGTVRARFGFLPTSRILIYGTGGLAYGQTEARASVTNTGVGYHQTIANGFPTELNCPQAVACLSGSASKTSVGWSAGAGLEYALLHNLTFKAEYLRVDLGDQHLVLVAQSPATGNGTITAGFGNAHNIARAGFNLHF